jgi:O-acetyl-ADP-ribose deacetylase
MDTDWRAKVILRRGDLTESKVDAIVNAANTNLWLGAGVAGAIRRAGGPAIQAECDRIGPVKLGKAAITGGGQLAAPYVIHAASMNLGGGATESSIREATRNSLRVANERGLRSIAFPAIGTGVAGFPLERCAEVMVTEVQKHLRSASSIRTIEFVLYDEAALKAFEKVFAAME